ncbi:hypothetical protein, no similarity [Geotrichum candidum]|uniref:Zn(2)-C6 fungal-type domain-containing protein n=1 Tax=Geotrichum candidum TaxID=1173061 RepID=A0A0J9X7J8_GEOCN|nr:hypothetical protein, no similarity [Geotrichum candidum]
MNNPSKQISFTQPNSDKTTDSKNSNFKSSTSRSDSSKRTFIDIFIGCWTCRRRGYKCDEGKPFCHNCSRLNLQCEGYGIRLKWQDDGYSRQRNKAKGCSNSVQVDRAQVD